MNKTTLFFLSIFFFFNCAGTIKTAKYTKDIIQAKYKKAYIVSSKYSEYIRPRLGTITPFGQYVPRPDEPPVKKEVIGNIAEVIKQELGKYGIFAEIGNENNLLTDHDLIVVYKDTWRWDFKKILDNLEISFVLPETGQSIAVSKYSIYHNKEFHNFPTPEKEVPKMIKQLLEK